jgi:hypothetical protein
VDVIAWVIWWVELDYPVYARDVETTGSYVCAEKYTGFGVDEFKKGVGAFLLFLFALLRQVRY